ncbi:MAG: hypothetical protein WC476_00040 [Phycisphaerae bacterium]|jgi:hypothetical protein
MCGKSAFVGVVLLGILFCLCSVGFGQEVFFFEMSPPYVWSIEPANPTTKDVIHIQGPFNDPYYLYSNYCVANVAAGCEPNLLISDTIYLTCGAPVPPGTYCPYLWAPVNAVECVFGPLPAGDKTFTAMYPLAYYCCLDFTVRESLTILSPNGGEQWAVGSEQQITWESDVSVGNVWIEYSTDNGTGWLTIDPNAPNAGSYQWTVPEADSNQCLVRVSEVGDTAVCDVSDNVFTIYPCERDLPMDFNGDCYMDFKDFAAFSADWLKCGNPYDPNCW